MVKTQVAKICVHPPDIINALIARYTVISMVPTPPPSPLPLSRERLDAKRAYGRKKNQGRLMRDSLTATTQTLQTGFQL